MDRIDELIERYPVLAPIEGDIRDAADAIIESYENGGKLLLCGNGGSYADCEHMAGELMKGFVKQRPLPEEVREMLKNADPVRGAVLAEKLQCGFPAIVLADHQGLGTAYANDIDAEYAYAQALLCYAQDSDVFLGISTSGNSRNVMHAAVAARAAGLIVIGLTGRGGGELAKYADFAMIVPEDETFKIQELHLPIYHAICLMIEDVFFEE